MKKVFVTGASGLLGKSLLKKLIENNCEVYALVHNSSLEFKHPNLKIVNGDVNIPGSYENEIKESEIIFHLAGIVTDWAPESLYYKVHVDGLKNIVDLAKKYNIKNIVYVSTIDIFEHGIFKDIDENTPFTISNAPYRRSKLIAYKYIVEQAISGKINPVILCPSWIYGPGDKIFISEIVKQLKNNQFMFIGNKNNAVPLIYTDNLSDIMIHFLNNFVNKEKHLTLVVSDFNTSWKDLIGNICHLTNYKYPKFSLPYSLSYFIGFVLEIFGKISKSKQRPLLTRTAVETVGRSISVNTKKLVDMISYVPKVNLEKGLQNTIKEI